jgi:hypothetical protein
MLPADELSPIGEKLDSKRRSGAEPVLVDSKRADFRFERRTRPNHATAPDMALAERVIGTIRREHLDHVIIGDDPNSTRESIRSGCGPADPLAAMDPTTALSSVAAASTLRSSPR